MKTDREIRRVCMVRFGGMGDILLATPALRALSEQLGTREIDVIVGRGNRHAVTEIPYIRNVIEWGPRGADAEPKAFLAFLRTLRSTRYDLFLNFQPSAKTVLMAAASGAGMILTFKKERRLQRTGHVRHAIDDFFKELRPLGITELTNRRMDFAIPDLAHQRVAQLLADKGIGGGEHLVLVNPGGTRQINRWQPARFATLLTHLAGIPGLRLIVTGGPDDVQRASALMAALPAGAEVWNLANQLSIKEMGALLARTRVFVTPDTGPMHIASAVGTPMVVLSGAADPDRTGPQNPDDLVVIKRDLPCVPCRARSCARGDIACMEEMSVEWVYEAVRRQLTRANLVLPPIPLRGTAVIERVDGVGRVPLPMLEVGK
ncbi:MAG: lipopolysaccharide heptosyltransferase II [Armatimonadaceae bacterium]